MNGNISAYFGDRSILVSLIKDSKAPEKLMLAENYLFGRTLRVGVPPRRRDFRLAVDRRLATSIGAGAIATILRRTFGDQTKPGQVLQTLYLGRPDCPISDRRKRLHTLMRLVPARGPAGLDDERHRELAMRGAGVFHDGLHEPARSPRPRLPAPRTEVRHGPAATCARAAFRRRGRPGCGPLRA